MYIYCICVYIYIYTYIIRIMYILYYIIILYIVLLQRPPLHGVASVAIICVFFAYIYIYIYVHTYIHIHGIHICVYIYIYILLCMIVLLISMLLCMCDVMYYCVSQFVLCQCYCLLFVCSGEGNRQKESHDDPMNVVMCQFVMSLTHSQVPNSPQWLLNICYYTMSQQML